MGDTQIILEALHDAIIYEKSLIDAYSTLRPDDKTRVSVERKSEKLIKQFKKIEAKLKK